MVTVSNRVAMISLLLIGCATYHASCDARENSILIPRDGGEYDVVSRWRERDIAERWALEMARETCSERGFDFAVTAEQVAYNGLVSEQIQRDAALARRVVPVPIVRNIFVPDVSTRNDYQIGMRFHCVPPISAAPHPNDP